MSDLAKLEGDVYLGRIAANGDFLGYEGPFECDAFVPSREGGETTEIKSKRRAMYGQVIHSETEGSTPGLSMTFLDLSPLILELLFGANLVDATVAAGTATDEPITAGDLGKMIKLPHSTVSSVIVKDAATGLVTYVANTDYTVNLVLGSITPLDGGAITAGEDLEVSYSYAGFDADAYNGETVTSSKVRVYFDGLNRISQKAVRMEYYELNVPAPDDMIDLLSSEVINVTLAGTAITPVGYTQPYRVIKER